jgi:hypothetical protein
MSRRRSLLLQPRKKRRSGNFRVVEAEERMKVKAMQFPSSPGTRKEVLARARKLVEVACIGENHIKNEGYNDGGGRSCRPRNFSRSVEHPKICT